MLSLRKGPNRANSFDVHIQHSKDAISQWLAFHNTGIAARAGPVPELDRTIRTNCDFIMQACGFEIDWSPDRPFDTHRRLFLRDRSRSRIP